LMCGNGKPHPHAGNDRQLASSFPVFAAS